jgi:hypothetical protein
MARRKELSYARKNRRFCSHACSMVSARRAMTPEMEQARIEALRARLTGKKHSPERIAKASKAMKKVFADPSVRARLSSSLKAKYASGNRRANPPETRKKAGESISKGYADGSISRQCRMTPAALRRMGKKISRQNAGKVCRLTSNSPEEVAKFTAMTVIARKTVPSMMPLPSHCSALPWRLRSPDNKVYEFRNLQHFVRENRHLFLPEDTFPPEACGAEVQKWHAVGGLCGLSIRKKNPHGSWKGWTWHSQTERLKNQGEDLLDRRT